MKNVFYRVVYGYQFDYIELEESTTDYGMITDLLIDKLESEGSEGAFISYEDIEENDYHEDEYITGGNHGRNLYHGGNFYIEEVNKLMVTDILATTDESINISIIDFETKELLSIYDGRNSIDLKYNEYDVKHIEEDNKAKLIYV